MTSEEALELLEEQLHLSIILTAFSASVSAAAPELEISPTTVNLTGNEAVAANQNHTINLIAENRDANRPIYNVTFPEKEYLYYSDNKFDLNASESRNITATIYTSAPAEIRDRFTYNISNDGERDPIEYYYNQTSGNESEITFDAEEFPEIELNIDTYWQQTNIETASL